MSLSMDSVAVFSQVIVMFVSLTEFAFFLYQRSRKSCGIEVLWVSGAEFLTYAFAASLGDAGLAKMAGGHSVPVLRYAGWLLTCPIILVNLVNIRGLDNPDMPSTLTALTCIQVTIIGGLAAHVYQDHVYFKLGMFGISAIACACMYYVTFRSTRESHREFSKEKNFIVSVMTYVFHISWLMFPVMFVLGPAMTGIISSKQSIIGHSVGDLVSKNLYSIVAWKTRNTFRKEQQVVKKPVKTVATVVDPPVKVGHTESHEDANLKILVVDRNPAYLKVMENSLVGLQVRTLFSPESIHLAIQMSCFDLILINIDECTIPEGTVTSAKEIFSNCSLPILAYRMIGPINEDRMITLGLTHGVRNAMDAMSLVKNIKRCVSARRMELLRLNQMSVHSDNSRTQLPVHFETVSGYSSSDDDTTIRIPRQNSFTGIDVFGVRSQLM